MTTMRELKPIVLN